MAPYDGSVTFEQAQKAVAARQSVGKSRKAPDMLGIVEELKNSKEYYIFNVGPWAHVVHTGSTGQFFIPACPDDKEFIEMPRRIKAIMDELIIKNEAEMDRLMDDGWKFALEVVGEGRGRQPAHSIRHFGVFPSKTAVPSPEDVWAAKRMLQAKCSEIVSEIRNLYNTNREAFSKIMRPEVHIKAARVLNLTDEVWLLDQSPSARKKCSFCGTMNDEEAVKCSNCHEIVNPEKYRELKQQQMAVLNAGVEPEEAVSRRNKAKGE